MKKLLLSLSVLVILGLPKSSAQIIPNLGFETWTPNTYSSGSAPDPNNGNGTSGWWEFNIMSNSLILGSSPITVYEGSSNPAPESGSHYAEIVSDTMTSTSYGYLTSYGFTYPKTNGIMFTGYEKVSLSPPGVTFKSGIPCSNHLQSFSFYYRYVPNVSDSCSCTISLYHWNSKAKTRTLLGGGFWGSTATKTSWTHQTVSIQYSTDSINVTPDTVFILFSACALNAANSPKQYDTLDIDSGSVVLGINNITLQQHDNVILYPNPANTQINLAVSGQFQAATVQIYDITGRAISTYSIRNNFLSINTQSYNSGLYFYKLIDNTGVELNVGKFSVVR